MRNVKAGIISGLILGIIDILLILPVPLPNKTFVLVGAFSNRFAIGLLAATVELSLPHWLQGALVGMLISILPAMTNISFAPMILGLGVVSGAIVGVVANKKASTVSSKKTSKKK